MSVCVGSLVPAQTWFGGLFDGHAEIQQGEGHPDLADMMTAGSIEPSDGLDGLLVFFYFF